MVSCNETGVRAEEYQRDDEPERGKYVSMNEELLSLNFVDCQKEFSSPAAIGTAIKRLASLYKVRKFKR
jgi:hypothetical protein